MITKFKLFENKEYNSFIQNILENIFLYVDDYERMKIYIENGGDVNKVNDENKPLIYVASEYKNNLNVIFSSPFKAWGGYIG